MAVSLLSACSWLNPYSWVSEQDTQVTEIVKNKPNRFLWQAVTEKLVFMNAVQSDEETGVVITDWTSLGKYDYKIRAEVLGGKLQSDSLKIEVFERQKAKQEECGYLNKGLTVKTEAVIFNKARDLYRKSLNLK